MTAPVLLTSFFMGGMLTGFIIGIIASGDIIKRISYKMVDRVEEKIKLEDEVLRQIEQKKMNLYTLRFKTHENGNEQTEQIYAESLNEATLTLSELMKPDVVLNETVRLVLVEYPDGTAKEPETAPLII